LGKAAGIRARTEYSQAKYLSGIMQIYNQFGHR
jgi:hypothetical protein